MVDLRDVDAGTSPYEQRARTAPRPASSSVIRRWARLLLPVAAGALVGAALLGTYGAANPGDFEYRAEVQVSNDVDLAGSDQIGDVTTSDVATQEALLNSQAVRQAARADFGDGLGTLTTTSASESSVLSITVSGVTAADAVGSADAYVNAYLALVTDQQSQLIQSRLEVLNARVEAVDSQLSALDQQVAAAPVDERSTVVAQQATERSSAVGERLANQQRAARLSAALQVLPVNVARLPADGASPSPTGLTISQWVAAGGLLGAGAVTLVLVRLAERRR